MILAVLPALYPLLKTGGEWTRRAILDALSDIVASVVLDGERPRPLAVLVRASVRGARSVIERIAGSSSPASGQATGLLTLLGESTQHH